MEWQPIETAPKDGTPVLLWDGWGVLSGQYLPTMTFEDWKITMVEEDASIYDFQEWEADARADGEYDCFLYFSITDGEDILESQPTHWMPLPKGPNN